MDVRVWGFFVHSESSEGTISQYILLWHIKVYLTTCLNNNVKLPNKKVKYEWVNTRTLM